jgi:arylsulfatase A-like enzyme
MLLPRRLAAKGERRKPNIIFILADDMSYGDLGCTGQKHFATPNLDRIAAGGIRFNQAYSGSPECAPSRASLMTGMHMGHCRIRANSSARGQDHLLEADVTVAEVLRAAGYATGMVGKWGIGLPGTEGVPHRQGFDYAFGFYDQTRAHGYYPDFLEENGRKIDLPENHGFDMGRMYKYNSRTPDKTADVQNRYDDRGRFIPDGVADPAKARNSHAMIHQAALDFIRRGKDKPFFLYYAAQLPHGPLVVPDLGPLKDKAWDLKHKEWAAMIEWLDRCAGEIVGLLRELDLEKDTAVFFASDNGYSQWGYFARKAWDDDPLFANKGPWPGGKFALYEGGCRVPLLVSWPGRIRGRQSEHLTALYDFLPTAAELAGVSPPACDGISLVPELLGEPASQKKHEYLYWENGSRLPHAQAARFGPWYAVREHPDKPVHLFDVEKDPACEKDRAAERPELIERARAIFVEAHAPSQWYRNPGQSEESFRAKQQLAAKQGTLQPSTRANSGKREQME